MKLLAVKTRNMIGAFRSVYCNEYCNRPFYRYGGHIELIRFKEYYRMPRGHEHISFVFLSAFRDIFCYSFLSNGKKDTCVVFGCNNDRLFPEK